MSDQFTEVTHRGFFSRLKSAFGGIIFGLILLVGSVILLFWNEGRAVKTATALKEGAGIVATIDASSPANGAAGTLVHFTGTLVPGSAPTDPLFAGISAPEGSVRLERNVEMYQWKEESRSETKTNLGGSETTETVYSYTKVWSSSAIDSSGFKQPTGHQNPGMPLTGSTFAIDRATVGVIELTGSNVAHLGSSTLIRPNDTQLQAVAGQFANGRKASINGETIFVGWSPANPAIGDLRISWASAAVETVSVVGQLDGVRIVPFTASNGREIEMYRAGSLTAQDMFDAALSDNTVLTWVLRFAGFIAMLIGFNLVFNVIGVVGDIIPFIGSILRFATGLVAFALTALVSAIVIGTAWIYFRPILGIAIVAIGTVVAFVALRIGKGKADKVKAETNPDPASWGRSG